MSKPVGYKVTPEHTRWKKGQSGNPSGRAKGQRNLKSDLAAELAEIVQMTVNGAPRRITQQRALIKTLLMRAMGGDARLASLVLGLIMSQLDADPRPQPSAELGAEDLSLIDAFLDRHSNGGREKE